MKQLPTAKKIFDPYLFSSTARWIRRSGAERHSHNIFRGSFSLESLPASAAMLVMSAGYAEIYVNGNFAATVAERSYIFDKSYEVFDISSYLTTGKNIVAVVNIDTGEAVRAGFALEIVGDGCLLLSSNAAFRWVCTKDESVNTGADYYICGTEERISADQFRIDFTSPEFDDSKWSMCEIIGEELLHAPYEKFHQSLIHEQTSEIRYPKKISVLGRAARPSGYSMRLGPSEKGITCAFTTFTLDDEYSFSFVTHGGIRGISVDGVPVEFNRILKIQKGKHFLAIVFSWSPELFIKTEAAISFISPVNPAFPLAAYHIPVAPIRYPWNEYRGRTADDDKIDRILKTNSFDALENDVKNSLCDEDFTIPDSVLHDIISRDCFLPKDGWADEKIRETTAFIQTEMSAGLLCPDALLGEDGVSVVSAQSGMLYLILDFGTETVGQIEFILDAPKGTVLDVHAFEMVTDNGIKYMNAFQTIRYVCREGKQRFRSRRRRGFRYLSVFLYGNSREVSIDSIHVIETRYPTGTYGFICSDETLCRVYDMSVRTAQVCMLDLYVDCPGYEQNTWTGDARVTGLVNLLNFGAFEFDAQYLRLIAESVEPGVCRIYRTNNPRYQAGMYLPCACFPTYPEGCIPIWSFMWFLQVCDHFDCTGDISLVSDVFGAIKATFDRCEKMTNDRGLFDMQGAWNLIEWANNDLTFYGEVTANNVMLSYCLKKASQLAEILKEPLLAEHYRALSEQYREAVNRYCWDETKQAYVDTVRDEYAYQKYCAYMDTRGMEKMTYECFVSQTRISVQSNAMALLYDCVPKDRISVTSKLLIDNVENGQYISGTPANRTYGIPSSEEAPDGYVHIGSPFFLFFALKALYKFGYDALAFHSQKRDWGNLLALGLNTCVETFIRGKDWTRSVAHAWSASPAVFLVSEVLGVKPAKPGYEEFTVTPKTYGLDFAKGAVPTPYGPIEVEWKKLSNGKIEISCKAPPECRRI